MGLRVGEALSKVGPVASSEALSDPLQPGEIVMALVSPQCPSLSHVIPARPYRGRSGNKIHWVVQYLESVLSGTVCYMHGWE